jgi:hypothetical protein
LIDDGDTRRIAPISRLEQPAGEWPNPQRREKLRRDLVGVRELIGDGRIAPDDGKRTERDREQPLVQRRGRRGANGSDAGQRVDAPRELLIELGHTQHAGSFVDAPAQHRVESRVAHVDAPRDVQHQRHHAPRIEARVGGRKLRVAAHEQPGADHEHDGQRDLGDHQCAEYLVPPPRRARRASADVDQGAQVAARHAQSRRQAHEERHEQDARRREQEHVGVDRQRGEARQIGGADGLQYLNGA